MRAAIPREPLADIVARRLLSRDEWFAAVNDRLWTRENGRPEDVPETVGGEAVSRAARSRDSASGSGEAGG